MKHVMQIHNLHSVVSYISKHLIYITSCFEYLKYNYNVYFQAFIVGIVQIGGVLRLCNAIIQKTKICTVKI